jgi:hypothetical protein
LVWGCPPDRGRGDATRDGGVPLREQSCEGVRHPSGLPLVGPTRFATGVRVAQAFFSTPEAVGSASGISYSDALGGGVHIALHAGPPLLVDPSGVDTTVPAYCNSVGEGVNAAFAYGRPAAIPADTITALSDAL